ncbi:ABC transporter substrate-binding protein [Paenibacillus alkalitolerans]|uniref:ABC transporter substrate-binding protein n=1 Tax=Paenibacillus alkalitolerans TaxID=2799335 RepID=UPI0018F28491|nr:ABC transporter substrate-binding protein [Paenibacillus alkalitolerans]
MNRWLKQWLTVILAVLLAFGAAACASGGNTNSGSDGVTGAGEEQSHDGHESATETEKAAQQEETGGAEAAETKYPLTVKDASGLEITFEKAPERIVALSPSETEVLFALGLGDQIVGVSDWSDYPEEAKSKPKVGGMEANTEVILEANPDLVVGGLSFNGGTVEQLRELDLTVFASELKTLDDVIAHIEQIGQIANRNAEAAEVVKKMKSERQTVLDAVAGLPEEEKRTVYIEFSPGWTVGKGEFMDELITLSGGVNVADQDGWYEISEEKIIASNPDVILFGKNVDGLEATIKGRAGWDKVEAIAQQRVFGIDDNLLSRPGPRVTQGLLEVAKSIYPEKFE